MVGLGVEAKTHPCGSEQRHAHGRVGAVRGVARPISRGEGGFGESVGRTPPRRARTLYEPASADAVRGLQIERGQGCRGREGHLASAGWGGSGGGREGLA